MNRLIPIVAFPHGYFVRVVVIRLPQNHRLEQLLILRLILHFLTFIILFMIMTKSSLIWKLFHQL